uniref:NADH dehydrogenase subunit 6 n=1 Tax=Multinervis guangxiensis TaxID=1792637 RepID=UPI003002951E|nr:NADH dehydrogenase subunit 6 [Multinervis guangxiensis]
MKMLMIKIMMLISITTLFLKNPMSMGVMLLSQTFIMIMLINKMSSSSWFIMITFLMMIGGLLILFMYMSSLASNEKFKTNKKILLISFIQIFMTDEMLMENNSEIQMIQMDKKLEKLSMSKMYSKTMMTSIMMILYLLLTMISISKIVKHYEGPLRAKTYE